MRMEQRQLYDLHIGDTFRFCGEPGVNTLITDIDDVGCVGYEDRSGYYHEVPASALVINFSK